ncbi:hypothetical protein LMG7141_04155 [Ralstonia condita]|uniref:Plasmid segregation centromere-binding protein ParG n=1 Tax=Ralstonia condita TaxID=3058600 RepID=A0ABN9J8F8_9RALS|nr:plasmid partition protein ParG [Ralstonia sp. LMG 7141]CAJ0802761.1 hypothetical protein LMG7141_04155 [Ralstonia sp. LMG 7141]
MSTKKVAIGAKPTSKPAPAAADAWVESRVQEGEGKMEMKRLTIDIPESLHRRIKTQCAQNGSKIADEVRELLMQKYGQS